MSKATSRAPSSKSPTPRNTASTSATILSDHPIAARWREVRGEGRAALIPYLTAGFPTPAASLDALRLAEAAGADVVEVGVPFSDPLADGPTIQRSTQAALEQGMTTARVLQQIHDAGLRVPVVIMTYLNPVLAYGLERFLRDAHAAGASGLLLTDFPAGADPTLERAVAASPVALIRLIAPTTTDERLAGAVRGASGFIYLISRLGVTGARDRIPPDLAAQVARVRAVTPLPVAAGFGISTAAQVRAAAQAADGVVVGSALVDVLATAGPATALAGAAGTLCADWAWQRKTPSAAVINAGREVVALVAAFGVYAALVEALGLAASGLRVELLLPLFAYAIAYFALSRILFYFSLILRAKLERGERMFILRYECLSYGATIIAGGTIVGTVVAWPPEVWGIVGVLIAFLGLLLKGMLDEAISAEELNKIHAMEAVITSNISLEDSFARIEGLAHRLVDCGDFRIYRRHEGELRLAHRGAIGSAGRSEPRPGTVAPRGPGVAKRATGFI